jgi:tetratricopeptide (TPR) repeat protein
MSRTTAVLCFLLVLLGLAGAALAEGPPNEPSKAMDLFNQGKQQYRLGEYDEAIRLFRAGYLVSSNPVFLFNIAQSYRGKGDLERSLFFYRSFQKESPESNVQAKIEALERELEARPRAPTPPVVAKPLVPPAPVPAAPLELRRRKPGLVVAGAGTVAAGVALVVTAAILRGVAARAEEDLARAQREGGVTDEILATYEAGKRHGTWSAITLAGGLTASVTGATLLILGIRGTTVRPSVNRDVALLVVEGRF